MRIQCWIGSGNGAAHGTPGGTPLTLKEIDQGAINFSHKVWNDEENRMKKRIISLFAITLIAGCSTIPSTPKQHPEKYTFQILEARVPEEVISRGFVNQCPPSLEEEMLNNPDMMKAGVGQKTKLNMDEILAHPDAEISEYPIVVAGIGESITNDQTQSVSMPEDYDIVNGQAVAKEKTVKLGYSVSVTVDKIENGAVSYRLNAMHRELAGFDEYKIGNGQNVKMPKFEKRGVDTVLTQSPNSWVMMGRLTDHRSDGKNISLRYQNVR